MSPTVDQLSLLQPQEIVGAGQIISGESFGTPGMAATVASTGIITGETVGGPSITSITDAPVEHAGVSGIWAFRPDIDIHHIVGAGRIRTSSEIGSPAIVWNYDDDELVVMLMMAAWDKEEINA